MFLYEAIFSNGSANIIEVKTGNEVIVQPFKPTDLGGVPWESEEEALNWLQVQHDGFLHLKEPDNQTTITSNSVAVGVAVGNSVVSSNSITENNNTPVENQ